MIFDNADDVDILRHVWPTNGRGSVLITTRDSGSGYSLTGGGCQVLPFDIDLGSEVLLNLLALKSDSLDHRDHAAAISEALGGLPLALNQIGGFIRQRRMALHDFLPLYERNSVKIDARKTGISDYDHSTSTVWQMSLARLSGNARQLLNIFSFLQPDGIDEAIFLQGGLPIEDSEFEFLHDDME